jgi:hypothetical protein
LHVPGSVGRESRFGGHAEWPPKRKSSAIRLHSCACHMLAPHVPPMCLAVHPQGRRRHAAPRVRCRLTRLPTSAATCCSRSVGVGWPGLRGVPFQPKWNLVTGGWLASWMAPRSGTGGLNPSLLIPHSTVVCVPDPRFLVLCIYLPSSHHLCPDRCAGHSQRQRRQPADEPHGICGQPSQLQVG